MKEKLYNIKKIIKDNSKIAVPLIATIVMLIVVFITLYFYKYNSYHKEEELDLYSYVTSIRNDFKGVLSRNRKNEIISLDADKSAIIDSFPIYNKKNNMIIFPKKMNVVYAVNEFYQYSTNPYSYLYYDVNDYRLIDEGYNNYIKHSFLYDGKNLYFFLDKTKLSIGDKEIELGPLSMVVGSVGNSVLYYDYDSDKAEIIEYRKQDVVVSNKYYSVNVMQDKIDYYGDVKLLMSDMDFLPKISDKKDNK